MKSLKVRGGGEGEREGLAWLSELLAIINR